MCQVAGVRISLLPWASFTAGEGSFSVWGVQCIRGAGAAHGQFCRVEVFLLKCFKSHGWK